jgi:hypothetical protein
MLTAILLSTLCFTIQANYLYNKSGNFSCFSALKSCRYSNTMAAVSLEKLHASKREGEATTQLSELKIGDPVDGIFKVRPKTPGAASVLLSISQHPYVYQQNGILEIDLENLKRFQESIGKTTFAGYHGSSKVLDEDEKGFSSYKMTWNSIVSRKDTKNQLGAGIYCTFDKHVAHRYRMRPARDFGLKRGGLYEVYILPSADRLVTHKFDQTITYIPRTSKKNELKQEGVIHFEYLCEDEDGVMQAQEFIDEYDILLAPMSYSQRNSTTGEWGKRLSVQTKLNPRLLQAGRVVMVRVKD